MSQEDDVEMTTSFDEMGLRDNLLRGIYAYGFEKPSPIQSKAIVPMLTGKDIIAQASSGTGKTGTFSIGTLQMIDPTKPVCQAILISPTRDLSDQIDSVFKDIGKYEEVKTAKCIGGTRLQDNRQELRDGACAVVGTPGRITDLIRRKYLKTDSVKVIVMDEADELLKDGFIEQIEQIMRNIPRSAQVCLFSATLPRRALEQTENFMSEPTQILVRPEKLSLDGIAQFHINVSQEVMKLDTLLDIYTMLSIAQTIIYVNMKKKADWLHEKLTEEGHTVSLITGDMTTVQRNEVMRDFRRGSARILVTTDLLCRGIDIQQVSFVINFDLPRNRESYLHRIGRSGRFGRKGVAINFITDSDVDQLEYLQKYYRIKIDPMPKNISDYV